MDLGHNRIRKLEDISEVIYEIIILQKSKVKLRE